MKKFEYKKLSKIIKEKNGQNLLYSDLLSTTEWKEFRDKIIREDDAQCQKCGELRNSYAWELKNSFSEDVFMRQHTEFEKKHLGDGVVYSSKHINIHVHHKYYIKDRHPWEYKKEALISVCSDCHTEIHETETILIYENEDLLNSKKLVKCESCRGTGHKPQFDYYMNGICFQCSGKGMLE